MTTAATLSSLVNSSNRIVVPSGGLDFADMQTNLSGMTSEILDGYEVGTFVPTLRGASGGAHLTNMTGIYTKIGNICIARVEVANPGAYNNLSGSWYFDLPFSSSDYYQGGFVSWSRSIPTVASGTQLVVSVHQDRLYLAWNKNNGTESNYIDATVASDMLLGATAIYRIS